VEQATYALQNGSTEMSKAVVASRSSRKKKWIIFGIAVVLLIVLGIVIYVQFVAPGMAAKKAVSGGDKEKKSVPDVQKTSPAPAPRAAPVEASPVDDGEQDQDTPGVDQQSPPPPPPRDDPPPVSDPSRVTPNEQEPAPDPSPQDQNNDPPPVIDDPAPVVDPPADPPTPPPPSPPEPDNRARSVTAVQAPQEDEVASVVQPTRRNGTDI
jgi:cytoskeletal protein RodZ